MLNSSVQSFRIADLDVNAHQSLKARQIFNVPKVYEAWWSVITVSLTDVSLHSLGEPASPYVVLYTCWEIIC